MRSRILSLLACLICFVPVSSFAWNALGHMVIADVAYQNLNVTTRKHVDSMVGFFNKEYPNIKSIVTISYWPDAIRKQKINNFTRWHYINMAFSNDGTKLKNMIDSDNAVWALRGLKEVVNNGNANPYERARFLAFLVHIVGDLHQPLHTITYMSANHPDGDNGGNTYLVYLNNQHVKLHEIWDNGLGTVSGEATPANAESIGKRIMALYPKSYFGNRANDLKPENWVQEGVENAKKYAYSTPENQQVKTGYIETGKQIAEQELALAGYRLAEVLNQLLG